ncbi:hypothetical protein PCE1_002612 [Barthelona sp. PCE]
MVKNLAKKNLFHFSKHTFKMAPMTKEALVKCCRDNDLYSTPRLNTILYLQYLSFDTIDNLDEYTGLKSLYLQGNAITEMKNLDALKELKCLFLQNNCIFEIDGLDELTQLQQLNLSDNQLESITNLKNVPLTSLQASNNAISDVENLRGLLECPTLEVLDLSSNQIDDPEILNILKQLPNLKVLYLKGNGCTGKIKNYRKTIVSSIPTLTYLDERPVFEDERRTTDAWKRGGLTEERVERKKIKEEKRNEHLNQLNAFRQMRNEAINQKVDLTFDSDEETEEDKRERIILEARIEGYRREKTEIGVEEVEVEDEKLPELEEVNDDVVIDLTQLKVEKKEEALVNKLLDESIAAEEDEFSDVD